MEKLLKKLKAKLSSCIKRTTILVDKIKFLKGGEKKHVRG